MEPELEQYLQNIGLSTSMLKSTSSAPVTQPVSATLPDDEDDDNHDSVDGGRSHQAVVDITPDAAGDGGGGDDHDGLLTVIDGDQADLLTSVSTDTVDENSPSTHTDSDSPSEDLIQYVEPLDVVDHHNTPVIHCSRPQNVTVNGKIVETETVESLTPQQSNSRSAVVFNTVPRQLDNKSTHSSSHTLQAPASLSSCTIMLSGETADVTTSSLTTHRAPSEDSHQRSAAPDVVAFPARKASIDATSSHTSTIIRCSASSSPVVSSRDQHAPASPSTATAAARETTPPPAKQQIKSTSNYVSVIQIGSASDRRVITTPADSDAVTLQSSPLLTGQVRVRTNAARLGSYTPIKSSLKKVSPGRNKTKFVSFSADDDDDDDDEDLSETVDAMSLVDQPQPRRPSLDDAVVRLGRDRPDGVAPRRALVSDSGVFCEPDDELPSLVGNDSKATQPARRTTVVVSGGKAAIKNTSHQQHQRHQQSTDNRTRDVSSRLSAPASSTSVSNFSGTKQQLTSDDTTPEARRRTADTTTTQVSDSSDTVTGQALRKSVGPVRIPC